MRQSKRASLSTGPFSKLDGKTSGACDTTSAIAGQQKEIKP
jgi:hypothetical protein